MDIVIPDDYPPTYASLDQADLRRLAALRDGQSAHHPRRGPGRALRAAWRAPTCSSTCAPTPRSTTRLSRTRPQLEADLDPRHRHRQRRPGGGRARAASRSPTRPGVGAPSVAELTIGLMLAVTRAIPLSDARVRRATWQHVEGPELEGKTLGAARPGRHRQPRGAPGPRPGHARDRLELSRTIPSGQRAWASSWSSATTSFAGRTSSRCTCATRPRCAASSARASWR